jgi:hypothetical protein
MKPAELSSRRTSASSSRSEPTLYRPAEIAKLLHCSEWWVKEQARKRRIPFSWIGGSYRFTEQHLAEIVRVFEVRPIGNATPAVHAGTRSLGSEHGNRRNHLRTA